jgi:hypothetical protein
MPLLIKLNKKREIIKLSKNIEKLQRIEESLNQLIKECKEEQFLYGEDSIEARKAKRLEKKLDSLETDVFIIKTDIAKDKPKVDKEIADYLIKSNDFKIKEIEDLTEENEALKTQLQDTSEEAYADHLTDAIVTLIDFRFELKKKEEVSKVVDGITRALRHHSVRLK